MKFGVREICDVVFKAKSNTKLGNHTFKKGEPVLYLDTATTSSMESAATTVYAQGGKGNSRLIAWEGEKTVTFTVEDALISPKGLAILSGAGLISANGGDTTVKAHTTQTVRVEETGTGNNVTKVIELKMPEHDVSTPASTSGNTITPATAGVELVTDNSTGDFPIYAMLLDENGEMSGVAVTITLTPTTVNNRTNMYTIGGENAALFEKDDTIMLDYYLEYKTDAIQVDITPDQFAGYYYMEASTLFRRQVDGKDLAAEFIIPTAKIQSNFTFTMAATGDPSTFTFTMDAMPGYVKGDTTKKVLAAIQILGADDNWDLTDVSGENENIDRYRYDVNNKGSYIGPRKTSGDIDSESNVGS